MALSIVSGSAGTLTPWNDLKEKKARQTADGKELDDPEKTRLALKVGDEYIGPNGYRVKITSQEQANTVNALMAKAPSDKGYIVFKKPDDNSLPGSKDFASTVYYRDGNGIDIIGDGGNYTSKKDDDISSNSWSQESRLAFEHDLHQDGNNLQQNEIYNSLKKYNSYNPLVNPITRDESEKTLKEYIKSTGKDYVSITDMYALEKELTRRMEAKGVSSGWTYSDQNLLEAVRTFTRSNDVTTSIDTNGDKKIYIKELEDDYKKRHPNDIL